MGHKCFISFKGKDIAYKIYIQKKLNIDMIDKSLNEPIASEDEDYIMKRIRDEYLSDSTVTIFLIGQYSAENEGQEEQKYIKRELQASLYNGENNSRNGILGIVLPVMYNSIYKGEYYCNRCGNNHNFVAINDSTVVKEFSYNYYLPIDKCAWREDDRYCVLVKWDYFTSHAEECINSAFEKRQHTIAEKIKVYPE